MKEMFFNIVPENLVDPFRGGNLMQVLFLSIFFGIVLNRMGEKAHLATSVPPCCWQEKKDRWTRTCTEVCNSHRLLKKIQWRQFYKGKSYD